MKFLMIFSFLALLLFPENGKAQLSTPEAEGVYGGRINWISGIPISASQTRLFISTESANSMFYADVDHSVSPPSFGTFHSIPDLDVDDGYGEQIKQFSLDANSEYVFALYQGKIIRVSVDPSSIDILPVNMAKCLTVYDGYLLYVTPTVSGSLELHFGAIDLTSGAFSEDTSSPITITSSFDPNVQKVYLQVNPINNFVYYFQEGEQPVFYYSSETYNNLNATTTFTKVEANSLSGIFYDVFGIAPDGRIFFGGTDGVEPDNYKAIAYSDDNGTAWNLVNTGIQGTEGTNFSFAETDSGYGVYFGAAMSFDKGESGTWYSVGSKGIETHPNDGAVFVDPIDPGVVYLTTDQGIGASVDSGLTVFEIDDGVEAVQIKDFEMDSNKTEAWVASKSGIRHVTDYAGSAENWKTFYPMDDGSPYYSVAMVNERPDTAFAGNCRLYKTTDGGTTWTRVFTTENPLYGFSFSSYVAAVEVHPLNDSLIILGVNSPDMGVRGGVFVSEDGGTTWDMIDTDVYNTEVNDILIYPESEDSTTVYVACEYVNDSITSSYGVKMITHGATYGTVFYNDMIGETGSMITNFGAYDLDVDSLGVIYACGVNCDNEPRVYYKEPDSAIWRMLPSNGLPPNGTATAMAIGYDPLGLLTPYIAVNGTIYFLDSAKTGWKMAFSYPRGTEINVLYWDDLLVGTGTGLYEQKLKTQTALNNKNENGPENFALFQNYPNPFNPVTKIKYRLSEAGMVELTVYNTLGQKMQTLLSAQQKPGKYTVFFNGKDMPSGIYFYKLKVHNRALVRKMILIK